MRLRKWLLNSFAVATLIVGSQLNPAHSQQLWTGPYGSAHFGYDWTRFDFTPGSSETRTGPIGGALAGINFYQSGSVVMGAEVDISWLDANGHQTTTTTSMPMDNYYECDCDPSPSTTTTSLNAELNWKASLRGRVGLLLTPTLFAYTTAGIAWADVDLSSSVNGVSTGQTGTTLFGSVVGAGTETLLSPNWLARLEVLHFMFQKKDITLGTQTTRLDVDETVVRAAVAFKFN